MLQKAITYMVLCAACLVTAARPVNAQRPTSAGVQAKQNAFDPALVQAGKSRFAANCAFCHGREATGGESGPDLTHSGVVTADVNGDKIGDVVRNGRPGGMPKFNVSDAELHELVAFLHTQAAQSGSEEALRRKITLQDLLTGSAQAGRTFFEKRCAACHSADGDLAHVAKKYEPMKLETMMLYPANPKATALVRLPSGETVSGQLMHEDEFVVSVKDDKGWQHSWPKSEVTVEVIRPADGHLPLLPQYSDADIHNVFAYLESLQ